MRTCIEIPEDKILGLKPTSQAKPGKTRGLMVMYPDLAQQDAAGPMFGWAWNRTELLYPSEP
jgi:hypothetical protein